MIKYFLENKDWTLARRTIGASGYDLCASIGLPREIGVRERWLISTGLYLEMPQGVCAMVCTRSGLAIDHGIVVLNAPGIIDSDYRGEVKVSLINLGASPHVIHPGDRVAQLVFIETLEHKFSMERATSLDQLSETVRGDRGHGSTGR